ncbi:MAG TPA: hypothetical protein DEG23_03010 [Coxiellaceae bacterium]|nr:hypothetical protein [Coxiellaceae bacterium]
MIISFYFDFFDRLELESPISFIGIRIGDIQKFFEQVIFIKSTGNGGYICYKMIGFCSGF